ncbi:MAG: hypothetical protein SV375_05260 [Thermodesulfobacteriota bacterium]|nr:hypothetical protein [Thermodesulfobacteriota bacterium]
MGTLSERVENRDKRLAVVCGLFCPSCTLYIETLEDPERLKRLAKRFELSKDTIIRYPAQL